MSEMGWIGLCSNRIFFRINVQRRRLFHDEVNKVGNEMFVDKEFVELW